MKPIQLEYQAPRSSPGALPQPLLPRVVVWCSAVLTLGLLIQLCVPKLGPDPVAAKIAAARTDIGNLSAAIEAFKKDEGRYLTNFEGFDVLVEAPSDDSGKWAGPYVSKVPRSDPWGVRYVYHTPQTAGRVGFDVISYGPDRSPGGGDDISNH